MIYYNDKFYDDFEDIKEELEEDGLTGNDLIITYKECELEPMIEVNKEAIRDLVENLSFERDTEGGDYYEKVCELIFNNTDFEKIEQGMPKLWYPKRKELTIDLNEI